MVALPADHADITRATADHDDNIKDSMTSSVTTNEMVQNVNNNNDPIITWPGIARNYSSKTSAPAAGKISNGASKQVSVSNYMSFT